MVIINAFTLEYSGIPIFPTSQENENWFKKSGVRKIEGGTKSRLIYEVLFYNNRESKQKYHGTLVKFLAFI